MPKIYQFADIVLDAVSEELEIAKESILSKSRHAEIVDARHMAVRLLHLHGIYPVRIAEILRLSPRNIHYVITAFDARIQTNRKLRNIYAKLAKQFGNNSEITEK